jgi:hypothetical protein
MSDARKTCIIVGRCYSKAMAYLLYQSQLFRRDYRIQIFASVATPNFEVDFPRIMEELAPASLILYQHLSWASWLYDEQYERLMSALPPELEQLSFPYPVFQPLWPFRHHDVGRARQPADWLEDDNTVLFGYSDANVVRMRQEGVPAEEIVGRYLAMDLPSAIDLEQLAANIIDEQRAKEAETDIKVIDFVLERYRSRQVFSCVNHGSNLLLLHMVNQVLQRVGYAPLPERVLDRCCELALPEIPVHPSIVRYYGLEWAPPEKRYQLDLRRRFSFEDYVYALATG